MHADSHARKPREGRQVSKVLRTWLPLREAPESLQQQTIHPGASRLDNPEKGKIMKNEIVRDDGDLLPTVGRNAKWLRLPARAASATLFLALGLGLTLPASGGVKPQPGNSTSFGQTLAEWENIYWRWVYGDTADLNVAIATDANGNAVVGNVVLMPIPNAPGDGTPGSLDVRLNAGQAFVLPFFGFDGNSYSDGTPPDAFLPLDVYETLDLEVTLDGVTIMDGINAMQHFSQFTADPPIPFDFPPFTAIIWFQVIGMTHGPLSVGGHELKLHVKNTIPGFGFIVEYNNTWNLTVEREE
jgi:hypothetical protein